MKAPFSRFNPKLPKRQRTALRKVYKKVKPTLRWFTFAINSRGQVVLHVWTQTWNTYAARKIHIGKRGGLIHRRRYTNVKAWLAR